MSAIRILTTGCLGLFLVVLTLFITGRTAEASDQLNCAGAFGTSSGIGTGWWGFDKLF